MGKFAPEIKAGKLAVVGAVYDFCNDYKQGNGRLVLVNIYGETDQAKIKQSSILPYGKYTGHNLPAYFVKPLLGRSFFIGQKARQ
jgi:hypothetical protein